jgi:hypothetical protein
MARPKIRAALLFFAALRGILVNVMGARCTLLYSLAAILFI